MDRQTDRQTGRQYCANSRSQWVAVKMQAVVNMSGFNSTITAIRKRGRSRRRYAHPIL